MRIISIFRGDNNGDGSWSVELGQRDNNNNMILISIQMPDFLSEWKCKMHTMRIYLCTVFGYFGQAWAGAH